MPARRSNPQHLGATTPAVSVVEVLSTRYFKTTFIQSLSRHIVRIAIVSPFVTPVPGFQSTYDFFRRLAVRLPEASMDLVTAPPHDHRNNVLSWQEAQLIAQLGVRLMIRPSPTLHSKVYYVRYQEGDTSSFVGSANFTKGGFESNDETVAFWRRSGPDHQVEKELARLTGPGSFDLNQWAVMRQRDIRVSEVDDGD